MTLGIILFLLISLLKLVGFLLGAFPFFVAIYILIRLQKLQKKTMKKERSRLIIGWIVILTVFVVLRISILISRLNVLNKL